jgi:calcium channel MID1
MALLCGVTECYYIIKSAYDKSRADKRNGPSPRMLAQSLWALAVSFLLSFPFSSAQTTQISLAFDTPVTLTGANFSTSSTPLVFSLPSSSQITISLAQCAVASSSPPRVFVTNSSSNSQVVIPGPAGGPDVFEVLIGGLGLGNFTLELPTDDAAAGVLAVFGGTTSDSLEIGVSQGGEDPLCPL